jgi:hypothetical protein
MDKIIQLVFVMMIAVSGYSQCSDSIKVHLDSCGSKRVTSSMELFSELFLYKKNLELLSNEGLDVKRITDSLHKVAKRDRKLHATELEIRDYKASVLEVSIEDANNTIIELDIDNLYLEDRVDKLKKKQTKLLGGGFLAGLLTCILLSLMP